MHDEYQQTCSKCEQTLSITARFCSMCGSRVREPEDFESSYSRQDQAVDPDAYRIPTIAELDAMRVDAGLSMRDLSRAAGFKQSRFSHILNNDCNPQTRTIRAFLRALQLYEPSEEDEPKRGPDPEPTELVEADDSGSQGPTEVVDERIDARLQKLDPDDVEVLNSD
jgi:transcriptional regulator with XRE-family HTH domain